MKRFAALFAALDTTTRTSAKTAALADYFRTAPETDRVWTIALLTGRRPKRAVTTTELRLWAAEAAGIPDWLFEESYTVVGDLAETIALLLPAPGTSADTSLDQAIRGLMALTGLPVEARKASVLAAWEGLPATERFVFNKLLTGGFRMGVAQGLLTRALAQATGVDPAILAHHLMGSWDPAQTPYAALIAGEAGGEMGGVAGGNARPYPFALASQLEMDTQALGAPADWLAEWKWDGIRGQLITRPGTFALWSRGEELITDRFPDLAPLADFLPAGTVIDGEILAWDNGGDRPQPFAALQKRIGRKTVPKTLLASAPARFQAYDLLEDAGDDIRHLPLSHRRARLEAIISAQQPGLPPGPPPGLPIAVSPVIAFHDWDTLARTRATARAEGAEGLMLKRAASPYHAGRRRGEWW